MRVRPRSAREVEGKGRSDDKKNSGRDPPLRQCFDVHCHIFAKGVERSNLRKRRFRRWIGGPHERNEDRFACDTGRKQLIPNPPRVDLAWTVLKSFRGFDLRLRVSRAGGGNARQPLTIVTLLTKSRAGGRNNSQQRKHSDRMRRRSALGHHPRNLGFGGVLKPDPSDSSDNPFSVLVLFGVWISFGVATPMSLSRNSPRY